MSMRKLAMLMCRGYWANAVVLLLSDSPSGGCSGLLLRPAGPSDDTSPDQHSPRTGRVIIYPDGSTTFIEWAADSEDDSDEEETYEEETDISQEGPVSSWTLFEVLLRQCSWYTEGSEARTWQWPACVLSSTPDCPAFCNS